MKNYTNLNTNEDRSIKIRLLMHQLNIRAGISQYFNEVMEANHGFNR
jgi:hypothetical protein